MEFEEQFKHVTVCEIFEDVPQYYALCLLTNFDVIHTPPPTPPPTPLPPHHIPLHQPPPRFLTPLPKIAPNQAKSHPPKSFSITPLCFSPKQSLYLKDFKLTPQFQIQAPSRKPLHQSSHLPLYQHYPGNQNILCGSVRTTSRFTCQPLSFKHPNLLIFHCHGSTRIPPRICPPPNITNQSCIQQNGLSYNLW